MEFAHQPQLCNRLAGEYHSYARHATLLIFSTSTTSILTSTSTCIIIDTMNNIKII